MVTKNNRVIPPRRFTVVLGLHNKTRENETQVKEMNVGQIFEHRDYDRITFQADLALLRLEHPAIMSDFVKPICLPDTDRYVYAVISITNGMEKDLSTAIV